MSGIGVLAPKSDGACLFPDHEGVVAPAKRKELEELEARLYASEAHSRKHARLDSPLYTVMPSLCFGGSLVKDTLRSAALSSVNMSDPTAPTDMPANETAIVHTATIPNLITWRGREASYTLYCMQLGTCMAQQQLAPIGHRLTTPAGIVPATLRLSTATGWLVPRTAKAVAAADLLERECDPSNSTSRSGSVRSLGDRNRRPLTPS
ncbi:hypothetical protein H4582DRAFT_2093398 [Lactarius indigo]|nr:hypothetical protein H4582DRAFT_2093398 [Lactarius indigo]